jgi:hypothetical protein
VPAGAGGFGVSTAEREAQRVRRIKREIGRLQRMRRLGVLSAADTGPLIAKLEARLAANNQRDHYPVERTLRIWRR